MNLPLHFGFLGALEAGLIAFALGVLFLALWHWLGKRFGLHAGAVIGWACVFAVVAGAGLDCWNLFYLGSVKLESPAAARIVLAGIHDADSLGTRVALELIGAPSGAVLCWLWLHGKLRALWDGEPGDD